MKVRRKQPRERLPGLASREHPIYEYENRITNLPKYYCPYCESLTVFRVGPYNIDDERISNEVRGLFDGETGRQESDRVETDYLVYTDFCCRSCERPVRVVYTAYEFTMASYHYDAVYVLELDDDGDAD